MSVSILEALQNAEINCANPTPLIRGLGLKQLHNAIVLLDKGYPPTQHVEPLIEQYPNIDDVPEYKSP